MKQKKGLILMMALVIALCCAVTAFAADSTTATVPVTLTVDNEYRAINVTIPASLPIHIINGAVLTADNARIVNNGTTGAIQVMEIRVTDGAYSVGSYNNFSGKKTIALKLNGCTTNGAGALTITNSAFPLINAGDYLPLTYYAKISGDAPNAKDVNAANVIITISIVH